MSSFYFIKPLFHISQHMWCTRATVAASASWRPLQNRCKDDLWVCILASIWYASLCLQQLCRQTTYGSNVGLKGQCHEIFCFWFFYESVSPQPHSIPLRPFRIFSKIRGDIRRIRVDHRCRWHRWQMKKIFNQKNFNNFVGTPLNSRVNIYIYKSLPSSSL